MPKFSILMQHPIYITHDSIGLLEGLGQLDVSQLMYLWSTDGLAASWLIYLGHTDSCSSEYLSYLSHDLSFFDILAQTHYIVISGFCVQHKVASLLAKVLFKPFLTLKLLKFSRPKQVMIPAEGQYGGHCKRMWIKGRINLCLSCYLPQ